MLQCIEITSLSSFYAVYIKKDCKEHVSKELLVKVQCQCNFDSVRLCIVKVSTVIHCDLFAIICHYIQKLIQNDSTDKLFI